MLKVSIESAEARLKKRHIRKLIKQLKHIQKKKFLELLLTTSKTILPTYPFCENCGSKNLLSSCGTFSSRSECLDCGHTKF